MPHFLANSGAVVAHALEGHEKVEAAVAQQDADGGAGQHVAEKVHAQDDAGGGDQRGGDEQDDLQGIRDKTFRRKARWQTELIECPDGNE